DVSRVIHTNQRPAASAHRRPLRSREDRRCGTRSNRSAQPCRNSFTLHLIQRSVSGSVQRYAFVDQQCHSASHIQRSAQKSILAFRTTSKLHRHSCLAVVQRLLNPLRVQLSFVLRSQRVVHCLQRSLQRRARSRNLRLFDLSCVLCISGDRRHRKKSSKEYSERHRSQSHEGHNCQPNTVVLPLASLQTRGATSRFFDFNLHQGRSSVPPHKAAQASPSKAGSQSKHGPFESLRRERSCSLDTQHIGPGHYAIMLPPAPYAPFVTCSSYSSAASSETRRGHP